MVKALWFVLWALQVGVVSVVGFRPDIHRHMSAINFQSSSTKIKSVVDGIDTVVEKTIAQRNAPNYAKYIWEVVKQEAAVISREDMRASTLMANSILMPDSLEEVIIDNLASQLQSPLFSATQLRNIFIDVLSRNESLSNAWSLDLLATAVNDPGMPTLTSVVLFHKGFHTLAAVRIANSLWYTGRDSLARYFQSLISRTFDSDIHPACHIGPGCYFSSGSGITLGETGSVGRHCSFGQGVTLGGTGKENGDRHPKVGNGVYFATGATVLGNIVVGDGSVINAGSVVTKPIEPYSRVGGVPAKLISRIDTVDCECKRRAEDIFLDESKLCVDADMSFQAFCDKYLFDLSALRAEALGLPAQA